jgi:Lon-like ATP-dependent protease
VGGVTAKIEAASEAGIKRVLIPRSNMRDVVLDKQYVGKIEIIPVDTLGEVLEKALIGGPKKDTLLRKLSDLVERKVAIGVTAPGRPAAQ